METDTSYAIQFYNDRGKCFIDEYYLSLNEVETKWKNLLPTFIEEFKRDNNPEMCIWSNMKSSSDYHTKLKYIHAEDCVVKNDMLYTLNVVV